MVELNEIVARQKETLLQSLCESIRIPSVRAEDDSGYPYGEGVHRALEHALQTAEACGFATANMDDQVGWCEYGEGEEMIAVLGHLDVVPEGEGWTLPPFGGEIRDGKILGRGTMDDKGPTFAALYAMKALKESGLPIRRRIRLMFGTNEETGCADMKYYLSHGGELPVMGFTPDGEYPVINGEKGIINETYATAYTQDGAVRLRAIGGGTAPNVVPASAWAEISCDAERANAIAAALPEKVSAAPVDGGLRIETRGVSAHGATPWQGENAIGRLLLALDGVGLEGEAKAAIHFLAEKVGMESRGESLGIHLWDEASGDLSFNLGVIEGDDRGLRFKINYRYPVTKCIDDCDPALKAAMAAAGFTMEAQTHKNSLYLPADGQPVKTLLEVYARETGLPAEPKSIGGGTYAKSLPHIVAFGPIFPGDEVREHKPDEFIEVDKLMKNAQIIANAMYELAK